MWLFRIVVVLIGVFLLAPKGYALDMVGNNPPLFEALDINSNRIDIKELVGKNIVLEWTNHECPYVKKHYRSGNMQRLQRKLTEAGVVWISVISSAEGEQGYVSASVANEIATRQASYASHIVLDPSGEIGRRFGAKTTPQIVLIDEKGVVRYFGAIDDKPSTRVASLKGAKNYLLAAWEDIQAGREVKTPVTKPYGCAVKYDT